MANAGEIEIRAARAVVSQHRGVVCGYGEKQCGAIALDIRVNAGGSWASACEDGGCSAREREIAGVAETIGKK